MLYLVYLLLIIYMFKYHDRYHINRLLSNVRVIIFDLHDKMLSLGPSYILILYLLFIIIGR